MSTGWPSAYGWIRARLFIVALAVSGCFVLLMYKAYDLQIRENERFREMAENQYLHDIELEARRGRILDRNGRELAASVEVDSVYANPRQIAQGGSPGVDAAVRALGPLLHMERRELTRRLSSGRYFTWLKRHILPDEARALRALGLSGISLTKEPRRYYPGGTLAGLALGWVGLDGRGLEGLELRFDKELRGAPGEIPGLRDALGREVLPSGLGDGAALPGHDLVTTLDSFIQHRLEQALEEGVQRHRARSAQAVALDVNTGEILALASYPNVNPNDPGPIEAAPEHPVHEQRASAPRNRPVTDAFEPGSTIKTFTLTGAIEAGVTHPGESWFCENGKYQIGPALIHDAEKIGDTTTTGVLAESSNICTAKIARRLGRTRLEAVLRRFGFGSPTAVDLPGERSGTLRPAKRWGEVELANISFGQGMTATLVQIAAAYAAIANGGTWYRPHIVHALRVGAGHEVAVAPQGHHIVDEKLAATMRRMLHAVMQKGGTGEKLAIPGYPAGGKTGTAQKVDPLTRRYSVDRWMSSFVGFAPLERPRLVLMVAVDEPSGTHYGGLVAGPIWREVMIDALRYFAVPPVGGHDADADPATAQTPIAQAAPRPGNPAPALSAMPAGSDPQAREIPDFTGMSMAEVLALGRRLGLTVELSGSGRAIGQSPAPGPIEAEPRCQVHFAPPG